MPLIEQLYKIVVYYVWIVALTMIVHLITFDAWPWLNPDLFRDISLLQLVMNFNIIIIWVTEIKTFYTTTL